MSNGIQRAFKPHQEAADKCVTCGQSSNREDCGLSRKEFDCTQSKQSTREMRKNLNPSVIANLEAVYGSRLKEVSTLTSTQKVLATNLGTRRGLGWKPKDGSILEFGGKSYTLDLDPDEGTGSIVVPAFDGSMPVMVTIASLCRMCEDTRSVLAEKCPNGFVKSLLQRGVSDLWRAEQLHNRAFRVKVFEVEKIDRYRDEKGVLVDRLDESGKPITYQATMVWLNDEVKLEEETSSTKKDRSTK